MGGNALKEYNAVRVNKDVFDRVAAAFDVVAEDGFRVRVVKSIRSKQDFGDIDVLVSRDMFGGNFTPEVFVTRVCRELGLPTHNIVVVKNGLVKSFGLPIGDGVVFQADIITTCDADIDFSDGYFAWNDCANLMGRIAHKMGLTLGHDGLWLPVRHETRMLGKILLTKNFYQAVNFLGFDADVWQQGFDDYEQLFAFIVANKKFNPEIFLLDNRNHTARVRDKKRPTYTKFLEHIATMCDDDWYEWPQNKGDFLPTVFAEFRDALPQWVALVEAAAVEACIKKRFNGVVVAAATGLTGKELGAFMTEFRNKFEDAYEFDRFLACRHPHEIEAAICAEFNAKRIS